MKIAIPVNEDKKSICISFGRTPGFLIVDILDAETRDEKYVENQAANSSGGAGIQAAQSIVEQEAEVLLTPRCGENAAKVLNAAQIKIYKTTTEDVEREIQKFLENKLELLTDIHSGFHHHGR